MKKHVFPNTSIPNSRYFSIRFVIVLNKTFPKLISKYSCTVDWTNIISLRKPCETNLTVSKPPKSWTFVKVVFCESYRMTGRVSENRGDIRWPGRNGTSLVRYHNRVWTGVLNSVSSRKHASLWGCTMYKRLGSFSRAVVAVSNRFWPLLLASLTTSDTLQIMSSRREKQFLTHATSGYQKSWWPVCHIKDVITVLTTPPRRRVMCLKNKSRSIFYVKSKRDQIAWIRQ